jgi:hypothetical protein
MEVVMLADRRRWLVALVLSSAVGLAGPAGLATAQGAGPDSAEPETATPDSAAPDSAAPDSAAPGSAAPDSAPPETATAPQATPPGSPRPSGGVAAAPAAGAGASPAAGTAGAAAGAPRVRAVHRLLVENAGDEETAEAAGAVPARAVGLGAVIAVEVAGLDALIAEAGGIGDFVLFLDGMPLAGVVPLGVRPERGWLIYRLARTEDDDDAWHLLLGNTSSLVRRLSLSVGLDASHPIPTDVEAFPLAVIHPWELAIFALLLGAALAAFFSAARRTDLLRDRTAEVPPGAVRPYSLARCQMAWWFFLVVAAYVFIWLAIDELDTITPSVLALIGIGAATALGAGMIDTDKKKNGEEATRALRTARATLQEAPAAAAGDMATQVAQQVQMSRLQQRADDMEGAVKGGSRGFRRDLLWDGDGLSLHRFQIVVWTLVLGFIFVASVYAELAMPDFSATLLGLMGISSGTYLGFKLPERQQ